MFLHIFFLPHYSCSLRSVSHSFSSANVPRLLPSFSSRSYRIFTCSAIVRSQAQSGKLAACLPGFCMLWVLAVVAVISTEPNSSSCFLSFQQSLAEAPKASICIQQLLSGKVSRPVSSSCLLRFIFSELC